MTHSAFLMDVLAYSFLLTRVKLPLKMGVSRFPRAKPTRTSSLSHWAPYQPPSSLLDSQRHRGRKVQTPLAAEIQSKQARTEFPEKAESKIPGFTEKGFVVGTVVSAS